MASFPIGRVAALLAVVVGGIVVARGTGAPRFRGVAHGVEFTTIRGEPYCRQGSSSIAVLRLDPARTRVRVRHFSRDANRPLDIFEWQRRTGAVAVFNAGQYYPDWSYMGLLVSGGTVISNRPHPSYQAALVARSIPGGSGARVLDLARHPVNPAKPEWQEVAQSFMLFDDRGNVRVRRSSQIAARTIVAEDRAGNLVVIATEGSYTLYDIATLLRASPFHLTHAMSMDGGSEAQLLVSSTGFRYASFAHLDEHPVATGIGGAVPLPAVVTVSVE